jgi:hypothetical protein
MTIPDHEQNVSNLFLLREGATSDTASVSRVDAYTLQYFSYVDRTRSRWSGVFGNGESFDYSDTDLIRSPANGGIVVNISGDGFIDGSVNAGPQTLQTKYRCRISSSQGSVVSIASAAINRSLISCLTPAWPFEILPSVIPELSVESTAFSLFQCEMRQNVRLEFIPVIETILESTAPNVNSSVIIQGYGFDPFILFYCTFARRSDVLPYLAPEELHESKTVPGWPNHDGTAIKCENVDWGSDYRSRLVDVVLEDEVNGVLHAGKDIFTMPLQVEIISTWKSVSPASTFVHDNAEVTVSAHGLDATLPSETRELAASSSGAPRYSTPDLAANESSGIMFNIETNRGIFLDAIEIQTRQTPDSPRCSVYRIFLPRCTTQL